VWAPRTVKARSDRRTDGLCGGLHPVGACTAAVGVLLVKGLGQWATAGACLGLAGLGLCLGLAKRWRG